VALEEFGRKVDQTMELSARDKRILAEIECESALEDPTWVRRFERLGGLGRGERRVRRTIVIALLLLCWIAAVALGATLAPRPVLWAALGLGALGLVRAALWHRRDQGPWRRSRRRIPRIPRQSDRPAEGGDIPGP
jgi:Protein of unknown function (DUF3040)